MLPHYSSTITKLITIIIFHLLITFGDIPQILFALPRLPNITPEMERPEFWIKKIKNPTSLLLTPGNIHKMNEENLKRQDLRLCRIKDLKEDWTKEEILSLLKEDWENFGRTEEVRYCKNGIPVGEFFWNKIRDNLNQDSIKESGRMSYALVAKRADIRVFPTDEPSMSTPNHYEFDRFQHSSISPGSPIGIYHFSRDEEWAYAQTHFIRGWIRRHDLAIAKERKDVVDYEEAKTRLVITGNFITVFGDPSLQHPVFLAQMGDSFPLLCIPDGNKNMKLPAHRAGLPGKENFIYIVPLDPVYKTGLAGHVPANAFYVIHIPWREDNGELSFRKGYIRAEEDVHQGFPPYTQENVARQAFKMLNHPYGWGDRLGGRDCSRFIMDLFSTFGILMPRNSKEQATVGIDLGLVEGKSTKEKQKLLDQAIPLATTLRLPGHIMLYLGKDKGKHYVIHSIWGIQKSGKAGPTVEKIGRVVVSDLSLGERGPNRSLLDRITDIRIIGSHF
jgi:hypothetical protein